MHSEICKDSRIIVQYRIAEVIALDHQIYAPNARGIEWLVLVPWKGNFKVTQNKYGSRCRRILSCVYMLNSFI